MAGSYQKFIALGNLGQDPEVRKLERGTTVARFSIATSETYTDKNSGEKITNTEWHKCVVWGKLAEIVEKYVKKGSSVLVEGKIKNRSYQDKDGVTKYTTEVNVESLHMVGGKKADGGGSHTEEQAGFGRNPLLGRTESPESAPYPPGLGYDSSFVAPAGSGDGDGDSDLPF